MDWNIFSYNPQWVNMNSWNWRQNPLVSFFKDISGYSQAETTAKSNQAQISYDEYLKNANKQALAMWQKNVPGRSIAVPGLSYPGAIYRADTGVARSMYNSDLAMSNFAGSAPYRTLGLYGVGSRVSRWI